MYPREISDILEKLDNVRQVGHRKWQADCPLVGHTTPEGHLSIVDKGDKCLVYCFNKHHYKDICRELGFTALRYESQPVAVYDYTDENGQLLFQVLRYEPKRFVQRRPSPEGNGKYIYNLEGVRLVPYKLAETIDAVKAGERIFIVEGEKDAETLLRLNLPATTNPGGAGKWRDEYKGYFKDARVAIIPDNDIPGYNHALKIANSLLGIAKEIFIICLDRGAKDVTHWFELGHGLEELLALVNKGCNFAIAPCRYIIDYYDISRIYPNSSEINTERFKNVSKSVSKTPQNGKSVSDFECAAMGGISKTPESVSYSELIRLWIQNTSGWWRVAELDNECGFTSTDDKRGRRVVLHRLVRDGVIEKHPHRDGFYRKVDKDIRLIDFKAANRTTPLDIRFPFGIEKLVNIFPGNIIVVAGNPDAGKTAFLLNFIKLNMFKFPIYYFSSEMGEAELRLRLSKFDDIALEDWKFTAYERSQNFHDVIVPDSINIIDYLEVDEQFYQVAGLIRRIHDRLKSGIAVIALQKNPNAAYGRGGVFSAEKARLYISLDNRMATIVKAKNLASEINPNGLKLKFEILNGCHIRIIEDWHSEYGVKLNLNSDANKDGEILGPKSVTTKKCRNCGRQDFWINQVGDAVCSRCHPLPVGRG